MSAVGKEPVALLFIYISPVSDNENINSEDVIFNIINDTVITNANMETRSAFHFL